MVSKDWMFVSSISMFAAILVIVEYAAVESENPTKSRLDNEISRQRTRKDCFGCGLDFGCFVKTLYFCWTTNMTYSEMCAHAAPNLHMHYHLSPQVNYCNISDDVKVFKYSRENINNFLLSASKPLLSEEEYKQLLRWLNQKSYHAANEQDAEDLENLIRSNRTLTSMLAQLCFADYKMFEIDLPQFIIDFKLYENVDN